MWSILYECEGKIYRIGPFDSEVQADAAVRKARAEGEFDIFNQHVYLLYPDHRLVEYSISDLI